MSGDGLADFLLARIAEDEAVARLASRDVDGGTWRFDPGYASADQAHMERHDPARVLAECEAKRRIVQREVDSRTNITFRRRMVLQDLAAIYADHPDFQEAWRD